MLSKLCCVCKKTISLGHHDLQCKNYNFWVHKKCNKLNDVDYLLLKSNSTWFCIVCVDDLFPFSKITDQELKLINASDKILLINEFLSELNVFPSNDKRQTCIDLIFTSQPNLITDSGVHPSLFETCHHQIIFAKIDLKFYLPPSYEREVWCYNQAKVEQINRAISLFDWHGALSPLDVNEQVELFNETLLNIFRNFIPNKIIKQSSKDPPWISKEIKTSLRKKAPLV